MIRMRTTVSRPHSPAFLARRGGSASPVKALSRPTAEVLQKLKALQLELERRNQALRANQQALEDARHRYIDFYDFAPAGYLTVADTGRIAAINLTGARLLGMKREAILQKSFGSFVSPRDRDAWARMQANLLNCDEKLDSEVELLRADASSLFVRLDCQRLIKHGAPPVLRIALTDVSRRKQAEAALHASEESYRYLLQLSPEAIFIHRDEIIFFANEAAMELFGAGPGKPLIGLNWHRLIAPVHWLRAESRCGSLLSGAARRLPVSEMGYVALDGSEICAESTSSGVVVDNRPAIITVVRDIAERKRTEFELQQYQMHLQELVHMRTAELREALASARQVDQTKDAFLAHVSHELRTPLSAVIGMASLALNHGANPTQRDYLQKIGRAGKHLSRIIDDLLDLSKIVAGRLEFESITFSLSAMLQHTYAILGHKAEAKKLQLTQVVGPEVPDILVGDPLRVEQILINLVGNAIKFTHAGRINIGVALLEREQGRICLGLDVTDTGVGMTETDLAGLFQPFGQIDASMSRKYGGTGLGLAISQRLAQMMDGEITVTSCVGSGSTFSARLWFGAGDVRDLPQDDADTDRQPVVARYRNAHVLVAEDHPMNQEIVSELLASVGVTPRVANNGQEALDILAAAGPEAFDLVLMDIEMPILDGLAATRELRRWGGFEALPIIAITAHAMEHETQIRKAAGMNDHVIKPFDLEKFYRMLARWIPAAKQEEPQDPALPGSVAFLSGLAPLGSIDTAAGLRRFSGNEERYRHWLAEFVEQSPLAALQIRQAIAAGEIAKAERAAHAFKGRAGMLGVGAVHACAAALDVALTEGLAPDGLLESMDRAIEQARIAIKAALGH